ncbi:MAG: NfeD family protein [Chloroflexi bacterium]|nr:NfeD family protein [Chloroflexota bacterium]
MCHLILLLPFVGLPLFWLMPLGYALSINGGIWVISALLYWRIKRAMREPVYDGFQSLIGTEAEVVSRLAITGSRRFLVRSQGELWSAYCPDNLQPGEMAKIVAVRGIGMVIERTKSKVEDLSE